MKTEFQKRIEICKKKKKVIRTSKDRKIQHLIVKIYWLTANWA